MYRHDCLDSPIIFCPEPEIVKINRNQASLPVVAVDDVRAEINHRQCAQDCLREEGELLNIRIHISVGSKSIKIVLIIYEIECDSLIFVCQYAHILLPPVQIHVEMRMVGKFFFPFFLHAHVFRQHHTDVVFVLIKILRQGTDNIRKPSCFNKWY